MGAGRDFKFGVLIDRQAYKPENAKVGQKGRDVRHVTYRSIAMALFCYASCV